MVHATSNALDQNRHQAELGGILTRLLEVSLDSHTVQESLQKALQTLLQSGLTGDDRQGAVFLSETGECFAMVGQEGLDQALQVQCKSSDFAKKVYKATTVSHQALIQTDTFYGWPLTSGDKALGAIIIFSADSRFQGEKNRAAVEGIALGLTNIVDRKHPGSTTLSKSDKKIQQAQKLESIGQLAAGIAHEINTPIQFIGDNCLFSKDAVEDLSGLMEHYEKLLAESEKYPELKSLREQITETSDEIDTEFILEELPAALEQSIDGVARVSKIVRAMKDFSHPGVKEKSVTDINRCIESTVEISRNEWKYEADVELDLDANVPQLPAYPSELNQVFLNLIVNAAHAIAAKNEQSKTGKGVITISTEKRDGGVSIKLSDTGTGIADADVDRIFDPFFTTKKVGKGTGQGLSIAYSSIVDKHNGSISVDTKLGEGTTFYIFIPPDKVDGNG